MERDKLIITKQKELICHLRKWLHNGKSMNYNQWYHKKVTIESELSSLEAEVPEEKEEVSVLSGLSETDKDITIRKFVELTAKYTLKLFMMLGLKTHIECMVVKE